MRGSNKMLRCETRGRCRDRARRVYQRRQQQEHGSQAGERPGSGVSQIEVQVAQTVGPDATPPVYFVAIPGKVKLTVASDERSGAIDADLKPLQGSDANVHMSGQWACLPDS